MSGEDLLGGDTPFISDADMRLLDGAHKPIRVEVDGVDATRVMCLDMCGIMWGVALEKALPSSHEQFMREYIGGANHDLRALGLHPLLSLDEVSRRYEHIKANDTDGKIFAPKGGVKP